MKLGLALPNTYVIGGVPKPMNLHITYYNGVIDYAWDAVVGVDGFELEIASYDDFATLHILDTIIITNGAATSYSWTKLSSPTENYFARIRSYKGELIPDSANLKINIDWNKNVIYDSGAIASITDAKSGVVFSQSTASYRPTTSTLNGKIIAEFDGVNDILTTLDSQALFVNGYNGSPFSIYFVVRCNTAYFSYPLSWATTQNDNDIVGALFNYTNLYGFFMRGQSSSNVLGGGVYNNSYHIININSDGITLKLYADSVLLDSKTITCGDINCDNLSIGGLVRQSGIGYYSNESLGNVMIYNVGHDATMVDTIYNYLKSYYAL